MGNDMTEEYQAAASSPFENFLFVFLLLVVAAVTFWGQAFVTEERFVPSLNVLATHIRISPDVAAATLMAAGAASPNLLAVVISMFVTHSGLGIGTIIGSEMFQQLFCVAGAVFSARGGDLVLSPTTTAREVTFYALSLVLLLRTLVSDIRPVDDDVEDVDHIYISTWDGVQLLLLYALYVIVCANFERIMGTLKSCSGKDNSPTACDGNVSPPLASEYSKMEERIGEPASPPIVVEPTTPFLRQVRREPRANFHAHPAAERPHLEVVTAVARSHQEDEIAAIHTLSDEELAMYENEDEFYDDDPSGKGQKKKKGRFRRLLSFCVMTAPSGNEKPSKMHDLEEIDVDPNRNQLSCFLWQQSLFHDKTRLVSKNAWQLRWFTFSSDGTVVSVPDRVGFEDHGVLTYPWFARVEVDAAHLVFRLHSAVENGPEYVLMAPSAEVMDAVLKKVRDGIERGRQTERIHSGESVLHEKDEEGGNIDKSATLLEREMIEAESEARPSIIEYPVGASGPAILVHFALLPMKILMHFTIPDVRLPRRVRGDGEGAPRGSFSVPVRSGMCILSCIAWLILNSYAMVTSLERIGFLLDIPDSVIGITISAVGTSIPIFVASMVAARRGLGNMAVSNVYGSNSFNILVGLGLPWTLYTTIVSEDGQYHGLRDEGISDSIMLLLGSLLLFMVIIFWSRFVLHRWHAWVFAGLYLLYLVYAVGQVYVLGWDNETG